MTNAADTPRAPLFADPALEALRDNSYALERILFEEPRRISEDDAMIIEDLIVVESRRRFDAILKGIRAPRKERPKTPSLPSPNAVGAKKGAGEVNRRRATQILAWGPQQSGSPFQDAPC